MTLIEAVTIEVGSAIAKSIVKLWIKDSGIGNDISSSLIDLLKSRTSDLVSQHRGQRQFDAIGEKVAESLLPLFEVEGSRLNKGSRIAVAKAAAETFNRSKLTSELLAEQNLEPAKLAKHILTTNPTTTQLFSEAESSFYQRIIKESCTYIVSVASQLPDFNEFTFAEILKREDHLINKTSQILQEIHRVREQLNPLANGERFEIDYRLATVRKLDVVELFGTDISSTNRRHRLSVAYITLSVEQNYFSKRSPSAKRGGNISNTITASSRISQDEIDRDIVSVDEILTHSQRILICGLAGSGKTTLLQWIAVRSASRTFEGHLSGWNDTIPFYIRLRHFAQSGLPRPSVFPSLVAPAIVDTMPQGWVNAILASGRAIVLIDGLDEVPTIQRKEVHTWLKELVESYPKSYYIITSRPHAVAEDWISDEKFITAELQPMEMLDIYSFIDHWHAAVKEELRDDEEKEELKLLAKDLKESARRNRPIRNLATTPLLCAMLCALNRDRRQQLPGDRIELYEACCSLLLERRDKERRIDLTDYPALSYRQKRRLLEDLAYWMIKNNWSEAVLQNVYERFERAIKNMPNIPQGVSGLDTYRLLVERAGIIREPVVGKIDFTHRTFQEFLAAKAASDEMDSGVLVTNAHNDQWREVIILASGLSTRQMQETLIKGLIERGDKEKEHRYQFYLLAVACLETSIELGQELKAEVEKRLSQLVPPRSMTDAKELASAGELAVKYLANHRYPALTSAACVRALGLIGSDAALEMLEVYANDSRVVVVKELIRAWDSFDRGTYAKNILSVTLRNKPELRLEYPPSLEGIQYFSDLKLLTLFCDSEVYDLSLLASLQGLISLTLEGSVYIEDFTSLAGLPHLTSLTMRGYFRDTNFSTLASLPSLTKLTLYYNHYAPLQLKDLTRVTELNLPKYPLDTIYLAGLAQLPMLDLSDSSRLRNLVLVNLPQLIILNLSHCSQLSDLSKLRNIQNLQQLHLSNCEQLNNLRPLESLTKLTLLNLSNCPLISDLRPLASLTQLIDLNLSCNQFGTLFDFSQVQHLNPLAALKHLTSLNLAGCEQVNDLSPLIGLTQLASLDISNCPSITDLNVLSKLNSLKELVISRVMVNKVKISPSLKVKVRVI